jgi:cytochrome c biogenesis protein
VAATTIAQSLHSRRFRTIVEIDGDVAHVYADHNRWGPFGTVIAHLSLVVILIGALLGTTLGFRQENVAVPVGSTVDIGNATGLAVTAKNFSDSYYANGSPSDYASELVVSKDGQPVAEATVRVNQPLQVEGVTFYQSYFGAAAEMKVAAKDGTVIFDQGVPLEYGSNDGKRVIGRVVLPDAGMVAYMIAPASGEVDSEIRAGQLLVELYATGNESTPVASSVVTQGQATDVGGVDVTFVRERQYTGLIVAKDPGVLFIWLGCFFLIAGTALVFFFPSRRVWAQIRRGPDGSAIHVAAIVRHDVGFQAEFERLSDEIKQSLDGPVTTH